MLKLGAGALQGVRSWATRGQRVFSQSQENVFLCLRRKKIWYPIKTGWRRGLLLPSRHASPKGRQALMRLSPGLN